MKNKYLQAFIPPAAAGGTTFGWVAGWIALLILASATLPPPAQAHKVSIFAWVENGTVYTESKFSGGRPPKNSSVVVYDSSGNKLLQGATDAGGAFSFPAPGRQGIKIVLSAGQGHLAEWTVSAEELGASTAASPPVAPADPLDQSTAAGTQRQVPPADDGRSNIADICRAVADPIAKELQALRGEVRRLRREIDAGPDLADILGGLGYIIGLVGIGAYFKKRSAQPGASHRDS